MFTFILTPDLLGAQSMMVKLEIAFRCICHIFIQESPTEQVIVWDIRRTYPAHDYFKDNGGPGQEALYKISKVWFSKSTSINTLTKSSGIIH